MDKKLIIPCLFTSMKTQKRKKFKEGEVRIVVSTRWASVHVKHEGSGRVEPNPHSEGRSVALLHPNGRVSKQRSPHGS